MTNRMPLVNASFEDGAGASVAGWTVSFEEAAEGQVRLTTDARTGKQALLVEKTNGLGSLVLTAERAVPIRPGMEYETAVHYRLVRWEYGGSFTFRNQELRADGSSVGSQESPHYLLIPHFSADASWQRHWARWSASEEASALRIEFRVEGSPATLILDDIELLESPPELVHPLGGEVGPEVYDFDAARATLERRTAVSGFVESAGDKPIFSTSDGYRSGLLYKHHGPSRYAGYAAAGVHFHVCNAGLRMTGAPDREFDFSDTEENILEVLSGDPNGYVVLAVSVNPSKEWSDLHPEDIWMRENGEKPWLDRGGHPAYGSPAYRDEVDRGLRALAEFLRSNPVGKVVVGVHFQGGFDGQIYEAIPSELDHSPGTRQGFQEWLRESYGGDVEALRTAWGDPDVTFETARVCSEGERSTGAVFLTGTGAARRVRDAQHYWNLAPSRLLRHWAQTLRDSIGRPIFFTTWRPDAIHGHSMNFYAVSDAISGADGLEATVAVQDYYDWRPLGGPGGINGSWGSYRIRGRAQVCEIDYRTYRSWAGGDWHFEILGATETPEGFRAQIRRDVGAAASHGMPAWYHDFAAWYDAPDLWSTIAESARTMEWASRADSPPPTAELAVFVDEDAGWAIDQEHFQMIWDSHNRQRYALNLSGVPYDVYYLDDIGRADLPEYRAYIFVTAYTLSEAQAASIVTKCRRPGKVVAFMGTPGLASDECDDPAALAEALTGIRCRLLPAGASLACVPALGSGDPVVQGIVGAFIGTGVSDTPVLSPDDEDAAVFGVFAESGLPSHAIAREAGATSIIMPQGQRFGGLTPQLVANIAELAGIGTKGTPGQCTYIGCGVAVCHRVQPGAATVTFGQPVDLIALDGETVLARGVTTWEPECEVLDTDIVFYRPASP